MVEEPEKLATGGKSEWEVLKIGTWPVFRDSEDLKNIKGTGKAGGFTVATKQFAETDRVVHLQSERRSTINKKEFPDTQGGEGT